MSALFRIVYAAHANGTHHKLALDALNHLPNTDAEAWRRVFLKHVEKYLEGAKAPDKTFKDFKNHVLHVSDNYWGGAPEKVAEWYETTVAALRAEAWEQAAYAAGVLSHYFTDPVMPFHTGQTEAENTIHRATEWSISRSYDELRKIGIERYSTLSVPARTGASWPQQMTCDAAEFSHRYYEKLIAHYDINRGAVTPEAGLDSVAQNFVAELLIYAAKGFSILLDRAIAEAATAAPEVSLTVETFLATVKIPRKWIEKKLENAEDRRIVQATYDELKATGRVDKTLSEDDRTIRDLHAMEVLAPRLAERSLKRAVRFPDSGTAALGAKVVKYTQAIAQFEPVTETILPETATAAPAAGAETRHYADNAPQQRQRDTYLHENDPLEDAPSIGPKMAARIADLGILTVRDFLNKDPHEMAELLDDSRISSEDLYDWQDQAQLVMNIPGLRGGGAQLLVGAGYRTADAIASADVADLSADVLAFATTSKGKRILRDGHPPELEKINDWVASARLSRVA
jgi:predicted flap endonuclease-1-like 5' DNA nuclease